jgi:hypothetical protein
VVGEAVAYDTHDEVLVDNDVLGDAECCGDFGRYVDTGMLSIILAAMYIDTANSMTYSATNTT